MAIEEVNGEFIPNGIISTLINELVYIKSSVACS